MFKKLREIVFRGQQAFVCEGSELPEGMEQYKQYGIRRREDENSPIAIEPTMELNRWGTIFTKEAIVFDEEGPNHSPYERTTLRIDEAMTIMNYATNKEECLQLEHIQ